MYGPFLTRNRNVDTAWRSIVNTVVEKGTIAYTERKGQRTLECLCGIAHLTDWRTGSITPQDYIGLSPQVIEQQYWPQYSTAERGEHTYTYGWCMRKRFGFNQIQQISDALKNTASSAFAQFWNPVEDIKSPDPPCINIVMFERIKGKVNLVEYIRSNDIARAWSEDVSGSYAVFLTEVAAHFGGTSSRGDLLTVMGSAHVYETALEEIKERFQPSYSASNSKPPENTSTIFGPALRVVSSNERCSEVARKTLEVYSRRLEEDNVPLYMCLKVLPSKEQEAKANQSISGNLENLGILGRTLEHFEGKDDKGSAETVDQVAMARTKVELIPESRRIVLTPNNPWKHDYSINPIIIQFLVREEKINTIALYRDATVSSLDEHLNTLLAITSQVKSKRRKLKLGPMILFFAPVRF
jgi:thymidylate synthase